MSGNTDKDFNHRSQIRLLYSSRVSIPHIQGWTGTRVDLLQGPIQAKAVQEGGRQQGASDDQQINLFIQQTPTEHTTRNPDRQQTDGH